MSKYKFINHVLLLTAFLLSANVVFGQDPKLTASAPKVVEMGEQFRLSYTLNAKGEGFAPPKMENFRVLTGPNVSTSSSVQYVNGNMTRSVTYTYTYVLLAQQVGKFTLQPAQVKVKKKTITSNPLNIEVVKGATASTGNQTKTSTVDKANISNDQLFVAVNVDKKSIYQGEHLTADIKVYTKVPLSGFEEIKFPAFTGFWSQDIEAPQQINLERENVNGQIYEVGTFKKTLLFPQRSGKLTIDPFEITMLVRQQVRSTNPFDDFFGGSVRTKKVSVKSKPVAINVKALPANKPSGFNGAVGDFKMQANLDKTSVKANEAINLKINISGNGNLKLIKPLAVDFPPDLDTYDAQTNVNTKAQAAGTTGSISFDYLFIPRFAGTYRIPPISFSYFDTRTKKYKTVKSREFVINVERGESDEEYKSGVVQGLTKEDVRFIGKDIRYIKHGFELKKKQQFVFGSTLFILVYVVGFIAFILIILLRRVQIVQNANQAKVKNRKANKISKKRLKMAAAFMKKNEDQQFYEAVLKAIWGYLSDKLGIPVSELSKDNVSQVLEQHAVDEELRKDLMDLLNACEFARFAPSSVTGGMSDIYNQAAQLISKLDQKIK